MDENANKKLPKKEEFIAMVEDAILETCMRDVLKLIKEHEEKKSVWLVLGNEIVQEYHRLEVLSPIIHRLIDMDYCVQHTYFHDGEEITIFLKSDKKEGSGK